MDSKHVIQNPFEFNNNKTPTILQGSLDGKDWKKAVLRCFEEMLECHKHDVSGEVLAMFIIFPIRDDNTDTTDQFRF